MLRCDSEASVFWGRLSVTPQGYFPEKKKRKVMKYLTLNLIKMQCRIEPDFDEEDEVLEEYGESAEETVLNALGRTYEDIVEMYGDIPAPVRHASLMLCDLSYQHRSPISGQNMYLVPYTFDLLLKPYMKLAT